MELNGQIFRGRTAAEARAKMFRALGRDREKIELVSARQAREGGFLGFGGQPVYEIVARPAPSRRGPTDQNGPTTPTGRTSRTSRTGPTGNFLARAYGVASARPAIAGGEALTAVADLPVPATATDMGTVYAEIVAMRRTMEEMCRRSAVRQPPHVCPELLECYLSLVENQVAEGLAKTLVERVQRDLAGEGRPAAGAVKAHLQAVLADVIRAGGPIRLRPGRATTIAFIGPTGVGKTTTVAKLAAQFALLERKKVALVTTDTYRIAAVDQLYRYGAVMRLPVREVSSPAKVRAVLDEFHDMDLVLIDTAGRSQRDDLKMNDLRLFLEAARADETHLVLSTTSESAHLNSVIERFAQFQVDRVLFTKMDEAVSAGVLLNVLLKINQSLSYVTTGQGVPDDIEVGDGRKLAGLILGEVAQSA